MFDESMGFSTYNDFFKRRCDIKKKYKVLKTNNKKIYRMYLYSKRELSTQKLDLMWEFLNEPDNSCLCPTEKQLRQYFDTKLERLELERLGSDEVEY